MTASRSRSSPAQTGGLAADAKPVLVDHAAGHQLPAHPPAAARGRARRSRDAIRRVHGATGVPRERTRYGSPMLRRATTIALLWFALAPAAAGASSGDVAATHAYVQANYALNRAGVGLIKQGEANIQALNRKLARECLHAGAGSPVNELAQPMSYEVAAALWAVEYGTAAGPIRTFVAAVGHLHWSNGRITRIAHDYATSLHDLSTLPVPSLCADVRAWTASGFTAIPTNVAQLDKRVEAIEGESIPPKLLAPFERGSDASVVARTRGLERRLAEKEFVVGQDDWIEVTETLGLQL
jgi:hypothetical protein